MENVYVYGKSRGADALVKSLAKYGVYPERIFENEGIILKKGEHTVDVGLLRDAEFMPEHQFAFEKIKAKKDHNTLALGLSYGRDAIREEMIDCEIVNLCSSAQDLYYDSCILKRFSEHGGQADHIIQTIAPYSFRYDESLSKAVEKNTMYYYTVFGTLHNNTKLLERVKEYESNREIFNECFFPITDWSDISRLMWDEYFAGSDFSLPYENERVFDSRNVSDEEISMIKKQYNKPYAHTIRENTQILKNMYMNMPGARVAFFLPPFSEYYKSLWNEEYYHETMEILGDISTDTGADILDFTKESFPDDLFRDSSHLNHAGARMICDALNKWISQSA